MPVVKIPALAFVEIDVEEFERRCSEKFTPDAKPKFALGSVVMMQADFGRRLPATVIGVEPRRSGWFYHVARPRWIDGVIEQVGCKEADLTSLGDLP